MFLDRDEKLIFFYQRTSPLKLESLKGYRRAGIKTIMLWSRWTSWHEIEVSPGVFNWDVPDRIVAEAREAGFKIILAAYCLPPDWLEGKIEIVRSEGTNYIGRSYIFSVPWRAVDPFHAGAMAQEAEFLERVCERYSAADVLCCYGMPYGGERILPFHLGPYTEQQVVDLVVGRQRIFAKHGDELWTSFHPGFASGLRGSIDRSTHPHLGNEYIEEVYAAMREEFPGHVLNQFITEFFYPCGGPSCAIEGVKVWVGAEYAAGVVANAKRLHNYDPYGLIMAHDNTTLVGVIGTEPGPLEFARVRQALEILNG